MALSDSHGYDYRKELTRKRSSPKISAAPSTPRHTFRCSQGFGWLVPLNGSFWFLSDAARSAETASTPPPIKESAAEPIRYVGRDQADKRFYDGALRHAVDLGYHQAVKVTH
jgi:hypothetical protein